MGGGLGLMPRKDSFYEALNALPNVHTTIITGRNQKLYDRLAGRYPHIEVLGFTDRVYDYMARADLVLTKPGGITLFESIFSELPILAWEPFLEQEKLNARFLVKRGLGRVAAKEPEECLAAIRELIYDDAALDAMRAKMRAMKAQLEEESLARILSGLAGGEGGAWHEQAKKTLVGIGLILALMALTGWMLLKDLPPRLLASILGRLKPGWLVLGLGLMLAFVGCEALCSRLILGRLGHRTPTAAAWATPSWASTSAPSPPPPPEASPPRSTICPRTASPPPTGP